ncbi:MAG TPA: GPW/gp25 family protein [Acidimicrobiales bacterium]|nr:GPW/gp25 family protein [Acidimicrobiales bacterium]
MDRRDYAYPFRIGPSGQAAQSGYAAHVAQMVHQVLLTAPGERIDVPEFGCGLRRMLFAPHTESLDATTQILVRSALDRWLGAHIDVRDVRVGTGEGGDEAELVVVVEYVLREDLTAAETRVRVL